MVRHFKRMCAAAVVIFASPSDGCSGLVHRRGQRQGRFQRYAATDGNQSQGRARITKAICR